MISILKRRLHSLSPDQDSQIWILVLGRFLSLVGTGFTLFYAPLFFSKSVGLTATSIGLGLGLSQIPGILGRILGGTYSDRSFWGRRRTLLLAIAFCGTGAMTLAIANNFALFLLGCLIKGFGVGLFWPASEALVADLTGPEKRVEAYALNRLADNLGLGIGVVLGGLLINLTGAYRILFVIDSLSFLVFFMLIYRFIIEPKRHRKSYHSAPSGWIQALSDIRLLMFIPVSILLTFYLAQINSTLPLQFSKLNSSSGGFSTLAMSGVFTWYVFLTALLQIPISRYVRHIHRPRILAFAALLWSAGFIALWGVAVAESANMLLAVLGLGLVSIATVLHAPAASSLVADIAPESIRGVYTAINSLCWSVGYLSGPWLGGWAMDQSAGTGARYWLILAGSTLVLLAMIGFLSQVLGSKKKN